LEASYCTATIERIQPFATLKGEIETLRQSDSLRGEERSLRSSTVSNHKQNPPK
jgi:hypothetical protein